MANERIEEGFEVFTSDAGDKAFGAVRRVRPHGRPEITVYVENAGDFDIQLSSVTAVHFRQGDQVREGVVLIDIASATPPAA